MNLVKTWKLFIDTSRITEADFEYLRGCCNKLESRVVDFPNLLNQFTKKPIESHTNIIVETINEEQESALLLKYPTDAKLLSAMILDELNETYLTLDGMHERL